MTPATVFHLVYAPLGEEVVRRFLESYDSNPAGLDHRLVVIVNGGEPEWVAPLLVDRDVDVVHISGQGVLDLEAYRRALVEVAPEGLVCFLNSYSEVLVSDWLSKLAAAAVLPAVGLAGTSGSWESLRNSYPWRRVGASEESLRHRVYGNLFQVTLAARVQRTFAGFPNPHLRTNAFAVQADVLKRVRWPVVRDKREAWAFESGRSGLTAQIQRLGLRVVVVGADGRSYDPSAWPASMTFRSGNQSNLLVADNRTRDFASSRNGDRLQLERLAWGAQSPWLWSSWLRLRELWGDRRRSSS